MFEANKKHKPWREHVTATVRQVMEREGWEQITEATCLNITFYMPRPKTNKRTHMTTKPDLSKLVRSVEDSLVVAGLLKDDSLITFLVARKQYTEEYPGVLLTLSPDVT